MVGAFACTLLAGRLMQLSRSQLFMAQGIALSMASGNMQPVRTALDCVLEMHRNGCSQSRGKTARNDRNTLSSMP